MFIMGTTHACALVQYPVSGDQMADGALNPMYGKK